MRAITFGLVMLAAACGAGCGSNSNSPPGAAGGAGTGGSGGAGGSGGSPVVELDLQVSPAKNQHAISPLIYGVNGVDSASAANATLIRLGGNRNQAYNWEIDAVNGGRVYGFENHAASEGNSPGGAAKQVLDHAAANGAAALITIPIGDYVAGDCTPGDVQKSGSNYLTARFDANKAAKGAPFSATPDLGDGKVYQDEFASWLKTAAGSTPVLFGLDNQPALWFEDHAEIHPQQTGYSEVVSRDVEFAKAIKAVWPSAPVLGYVGYGWQSFVNLQNSPDSTTQGEFLSYYLDQMKAAEATNGKRLIDYLDLHWWPEAQGAGMRVIVPDSGPEVVDARLQAPRELWDTTYYETSWIQDLLGSDTIHLIPRVKQEIQSHYPGTKLSISAWYYGGGGDISGAIATADVLGIFGREGVDAAAVDLSGGDDAYTLAGFAAYLDYDGAGARFGDTSVSAVTNDLVGSSVYASTDSSNPEHVVVIALNKRSFERPTTLTLDSTTSYTACRLYTLTSKSSHFVKSDAPHALGNNAFSYTMPPRSVSVIVPQ